MKEVWYYFPENEEFFETLATARDACGKGFIIRRNNIGYLADAYWASTDGWRIATEEEVEDIKTRYILQQCSL